MNLSEIMWKEWHSAPMFDRISASSEFAGIIESLELLQSRPGFVQLICHRSRVYERWISLWKRLSSSYPDHLVAVQRTDGERWSLILSSKLYQLLLTPPVSVGQFLSWPWVRGVWGVCGSLYMPKNGSYGTARIKSPTVASKFARILEQYDLSVKTRKKSGCYEIMLRHGESLQNFLHYLELVRTAGQLEDGSLQRKLRDLVNRQTNCDRANITRTVQAAKAQTHLANYAKVALELDDQLTELIELRLNYPGATLAELGMALSQPMSKSTVKYRWNKVLKMAIEHGYQPHLNEENEVEVYHGKDTCSD